VGEQSTPEEREMLARLEEWRVTQERLATNRERDRAKLETSGASRGLGPNRDQRPGRRRRETKHDKLLAAALRIRGFDWFASRIDRRSAEQAKALANPLHRFVTDLELQLRSVFVRQHGRRGPPDEDSDGDAGGPGWGQALRKLSVWLGIEKEISRGRR
jgi:hypothetical protein